MGKLVKTINFKHFKYSYWNEQMIILCNPSDRVERSNFQLLQEPSHMEATTVMNYHIHIV